MKKTIPVTFFILLSSVTFAQNNPDYCWPLPQTLYFLQNILDPAGHLAIDSPENTITFRFTPNKRYADSNKRTGYLGDLYSVYFTLAHENDSNANKLYKNLCFALTGANKAIIETLCYPVIAGVVTDSRTTRKQIQFLFTLLPAEMRFTFRKHNLRIYIKLPNGRWYNPDMLTGYTRCLCYVIFSYIFHANPAQLHKVACTFYRKHRKKWFHRSTIDITEKDGNSLYPKKLVTLHQDTTKPATHE